MSRGTRGSFLWIWDSADIKRQLAGGPDATPIGCGRNDQGAAPSNVGPCDLLDVFPQNLVEVDENAVPTGNVVGELNGFGRLHGKKLFSQVAGEYNASALGDLSPNGLCKVKWLRGTGLCALRSPEQRHHMSDYVFQ